jgi:hypothetical protein
MVYMTGILPIAKYSSGSDLNNLGSYWVNSGPRDEILTFIEKNVSDIRVAIALMASGEPVTVQFAENAVSTNMAHQTKDEMLSIMDLYGLLSIKAVSKTTVCIPNKEVMGKFTILLAKESSLCYIHC